MQHGMASPWYKSALQSQSYEHLARGLLDNLTMISPPFILSCSYSKELQCGQELRLFEQVSTRTYIKIETAKGDILTTVVFAVQELLMQSRLFLFLSQIFAV
jgi:hypothetical protein